MVLEVLATFANTEDPTCLLRCDAQIDIQGRRALDTASQKFDGYSCFQKYVLFILCNPKKSGLSRFTA
jgi:hypothetical protein